MAGTITVVEVLETVEVKGGDTIAVTEQLQTVEVVDGDTITVNEVLETVELKAGDQITVQEVLQTVEIGGADHPAVPRDHVAVVGPFDADYASLQSAHDAGATAIHLRNGSYAGFNWTDPTLREIGGESLGARITGDCLFGVAGVTIRTMEFKADLADQVLKLTPPDPGTGLPAEAITFDGVAFGGHATYITRIRPGLAGTLVTPVLKNCRLNGGPPTSYSQAWNFTGPATYADITAALTAAAPGGQQILGAGAVNDAVYLGFSSLLRIAVLLAIRPKGPTFSPTGTVAYEYWNGTAWATLVIGFTHNDARVFRAAGYGSIMLPINWAQTAVNGVTAYWMRIRVTATFTTVPVVVELAPMGNMTITDYDEVAQSRRGWANAQMKNCEFKDYQRSVIAEINGSPANLVGLSYRGNTHSELLVAPAGSVVQLSATDVGRRGVRLGVNCLADIAIVGAPGDLIEAFEGGQVLTATANTIEFQAPAADGGGGPTLPPECSFLEVLILSGLGMGQRRVVLENTGGGATGPLTIRDNWTTIPDTTSTAVVYDPLHNAIICASGCVIGVNLRRFGVGVRPLSITFNRFAVHGFMESVGINVQSGAVSVELNRPFFVGPLISSIGADGHGARGAIVDMSGGLFGSAYTATPEINASEAVIIGALTGDKGVAVMVGKSTRTRALGNLVPSTTIPGAGISGDLIPHVDNELDVGSAAKALAEAWAYIHGVRNYVEMDEATQAAAPGANKAREQAIDNGLGTGTWKVIRFPTGAVQVIATEPTAIQTLAAAGNAILANALMVQIDNSTGAPLTLTSTPTIAGGLDGQELTIINVDSADNVILQNETVLAGSNLRLAGAANLTLGPRDSVTLRYNAALGDWIQVAASNN